MIVAAAFSNSGAVLEPVRAMLRAQATPECAIAEFFSGEECAIGWAMTSDRHAPFPFARRGAQGNVLVVTGTPIASAGGLDKLLARATDLDASAATALLSGLDGAFAILHWDHPARILSIVTDFLGIQPLHVAHAPGTFYCSTALRGLTGAGMVAARPDAAAWGSFFVFGHPLGDRTLIEGVRRAPAGTILTLRLPGPVEERRTYWDWPAPGDRRHEPPTAAIADALKASVHGYREYGHAGAVLMSGGFDSRAVLLCLRNAGLMPRALVVRHADEAGDADARLGRRAARLAGIEAEVIAPPPDFHESAAYRRYLERSELSNPPLEVFIPRVISALRPDLGCVWDGLCVQSLRTLPDAPTSFQAYLERPSMRARGLLASPSPFRIDWAQAMYEGFARLLREECARYRDDEHGVVQFSLRNRTRLRIAANPYRVFAFDALPFTPGLTRAFYSIVGGLANRHKGAHRLVHRVYRDYFPEGLRVPFISGGRLVNLSGRRSWEYTRASVMQALTGNWYVAEALRRARLARRPLYGDPEQIQALIPPGSGADDCLDQRLLHAGTVGPMEMRRLYYWSVGRALFQPAAPRLGAAQTTRTLSEDVPIT
jgi:hypothetical protein